MIDLDLHGKNTYQAKIAIDAALRRAGAGEYRIRVVHGHWHGDALRSFIADEYGKHPRVLRIECSPDGGRSELVLREY